MSRGRGRHTWTIIGHVARARVKQRAAEVIHTSGSDTHTHTIRIKRVVQTTV